MTPNNTSNNNSDDHAQTTADRLAQLSVTLTLNPKPCGQAAQRRAPDSSPLCDAHHSVLLHHDLCPICLDSNTCAAMALQLPCQHVFHAACMAKWNFRANTCPVCRHEFRPPGIAASVAGADARDQRPDNDDDYDNDDYNYDNDDTYDGDDQDDDDEYDVLLTEEDLMMLMLDDDITDIAEVSDQGITEDAGTVNLADLVMNQPPRSPSAFYDSFANLYLGVD